ncbi:hypothetical protein A3A68_02015 [Candidatus Saccharibacteria bacterium RIFCSPLOWO2_01_FULL_48_13]|nr:MAG: hypothetical protein A3F38_01365 [Candidatus Saccharibacteria bacterium RIFCSPHIGHO2_12_FULL_48_21]OGL37199.1 MAG: hypothetical protein A3A68_02015 [Candidatus Saccharibacteria bacterium RIFCSPLOWO2_01_FULL_48_13]
MKNFLKNIVAGILGWQVRRLRRKNNFKVVAVAGSVGKTSTKLAIAQVLSQSYAVRYQKGNYNDLVSVPLIFFGQSMPSLFNPLAWLAIFWNNERILRKKYPYEIVVVELGTDKPGDIEPFSRYLRADFGVLTGIAPEHMELFADLNAVAKEELTLASLSNELLVNKDLCADEFLKEINGPFQSYGVKTPADYRLSGLVYDKNFANFKITHGHKLVLDGRHESISEPQLLSVCAAAGVADQFNMKAEEIEKGIRLIKPVSGRMRQLDGINNSLIIDDTYNASPEAVMAALNTLYRLNAPQKIAVLGNMNELGSYSQRLHEEAGRYCDPREIDLLVTIGSDASKYLAAEATKKGCVVETFDSPLTAGEYIKTKVKNGAVILVKGSQNGVFAEETVKKLLVDPADARKLVRQTPYWLKIKKRSLGKLK